MGFKKLKKFLNKCKKALKESWRRNKIRNAVPKNNQNRNLDNNSVVGNNQLVGSAESDTSTNSLLDDSLLRDNVSFNSTSSSITSNSEFLLAGSTSSNEDIYGENNNLDDSIVSSHSSNCKQPNDRNIIWKRSL